MSSGSTDKLTPEALHKLIQASFKGRDRAYAPYSKFNVGAGLLLADGSMVIGCNVENAATPAGICAERTAMVKTIKAQLWRPKADEQSDGNKSVIAVAVTSHMPTPTISPCGICRQFMREFLPLSTPILMVAASYPLSDDSVPSYVADLGQHIDSRTAEGEGLGGSKKEMAGFTWSKEVTVLSLEELLPMSFGPEQLAEGTDKA